MRKSKAEIIREYGPFPGCDQVGGVSFDGQNAWIAAGDKLMGFDPEGGELVRSIEVAAHAGTAFDGRPLLQISDSRIQKIDPKTGRAAPTIPAAGTSRDS